MNTKTIRTMSGAAATPSLNAKETAVIVVDIQYEYYAHDGETQPKMVIPDGMAVLNNSKKIVEFARKNHMPVFFVGHVGPADGPLFQEGGRNSAFHDDLLPNQGEAVIMKATPSSFVGTDLDAQLKAAGIKQLIVIGLMSHMCISSTARDAVPLGYAVLIPDDATATRDLESWDGSVVDHKTLHRSALSGVADVFAEITLTDRLLKMPVTA